MRPATLIRLIGGLVFGYVGDIYGRKATLVLSTAAMAIPTFAIGLLPPAAQVVKQHGMGEDAIEMPGRQIVGSCAGMLLLEAGIRAMAAACGVATRRLRAPRHMLLAAGDLLAQGDVDGACGQLRRAADRTDGAFPPFDFAKGEAAPDLLDAITGVQDELGCFA